jgi:hypothetical protein
MENSELSRKEQRWTMSKNEVLRKIFVPKREEITKEWRKFII